MVGRFQNTLYTNDNLFILNGTNSESVDLIYLDPPFNSKRTYSAPIGSKSAGASFRDMWSWEDVNKFYLDKLFTNYPFLVSFIQSIEGIHSKAMMSYITYMTQRLIELHRVLKPTGSLYLHIDPTASHYLKIILDRIFGSNNFRNEIIWHYDGPQRPSKKNFATKHDVILRYSKSDEFRSEEDGLRNYIVVSKEELKARYKRFTDGRYYDTIPRGDYTDESIRRLDKENRIEYSPNGKPRIRRFLDIDSKGNFIRKKPLHDVWSDIVSLGHAGRKESTGYPTQKPLALLYRIIKASSSEGDIILDPFCGCATACVAAQQLGRKWIGIDIEKQAVTLLVDRLSNDSGLFTDFIHRYDIPKRTDISVEPPNRSMKERLFLEQEGLCNGCNTNMGDIRHYEIDHIIPKSKGGGDYYTNYQLLCPSCNRIKGNRPMEYLITKNKKREELLRHKLSFT